MKKIYIITMGLCVSLGTMHTLFSAAAAEDVAEQETAWVEKQKARQEAINQENLTPEQKALGQELQSAAGIGDVKRVKELLEQGAPVNFESRNGTTSLMSAIISFYDTLPIITLLLNVGAQVNHRNREGKTALSMIIERAGEGKPLSYCIALIKAGADVNIPDQKGVTPLMWAANKKKIRMINVLLGAGALVNQQDSDGYTPLMYAALNNDSDMVRVLISAGANPNLVNNEGQTVLALLENAYGNDLIYEQMSKVIQQAIEKRQYEEYVEGMQKELEEELPLPPVLRGLVLDYEQKPDTSAQRRLKERQKVRALQVEREPVVAAQAAASARKKSEAEEKEAGEKEEVAAMPAAGVVQARMRRVSGVEAGEGERETFYGSALRAAQETRELRQQEGFQPGQVPLPDPETGFYDED